MTEEAWLRRAALSRMSEGNTAKVEEWEQECECLCKDEPIGEEATGFRLAVALAEQFEMGTGDWGSASKERKVFACDLRYVKTLTLVEGRFRNFLGDFGG